MELSAATLLFLSFVSLTILVSLLSRKKTASSKGKKPPGPRCLPFIGSLLHLRTATPQVALRDLAKKHGPVMYLRLGQVDAVVISSPAAAQEVLRDSSLNFASRPTILAAEIVGYGSADIAFAPYGAYWRTLRKLCMVELLSARKVRQFAPIRDSETMSLVRDVRAAAAAGGGGQPVNMRKLLVSCTNTITARATFGDGCDAELQEQFLAAMNVLLTLTGGFCVGDLFPSLRFVDVVTGLRRSLWGARRQFDAIFDKIIAICEARRAEKNTGDDDLLSVMLRIKDEEQLEFPIGITNIKAITVDLFTAGTETTSSILEWIMSELMRNPEVMVKAQAEVRQTLDNKSLKDHEVHMEKLRYMKMVIKEGLRLHPAAPLLLPRVCRETCNVNGFEIVEGSRVMVNAWGIARNPEYWHDADKFKPERFEDITVDYNGTQFEYLPFGSGRRMCPGGTFGLATLELILARLLYFFDWSLPAGMRPDELDMDMTVGATLRRRNQLHLVAMPYNFPMKI
ncbi:cytochrome P450 99A2-like [Triticum urartu]|uniref:Cytochrome P450 99A2 n=1 Tax=Triticum urartu TaxID=4572 RepID=A0A8R7TLX6_TRIUA|nr:cytochrome P450 99A2-like [Triticum dicoccoides]XP_048553194.1 cytochrome P450 99A2-like [Triticum urartu]